MERSLCEEKEGMTNEAKKCWLRKKKREPQQQQQY